MSAIGDARLYLATGNPGKVRDFAGIGLEISPLPGYEGYPEIEETGTTFEANARLKAEHYSQFTSEFVLADDSGLEVEALDGAPGVYSARFAGGHGDDEANNRLLLGRMKNVPEPKRGARFVCVLALAQSGRTVASFTGECKGRILNTGRGDQGFGYDPLFYSAEAGRGFGELSAEIKARYSHRGRAAEALKAWLSRKS